MRTGNVASANAFRKQVLLMARLTAQSINITKRLCAGFFDDLHAWFCMRSGELSAGGLGAIRTLQAAFGTRSVTRYAGF